MPLYPVYCRFILILFFDLHLSSPSGLFPSGFRQIPCTSAVSHTCLMCLLSLSSWLDYSKDSWYGWRTDRVARRYKISFSSSHRYSCIIIIKINGKWSRYRPGVAQRVGRGIALLFHDRGTRRWWMVSSMPRPHFASGKDPVPILQEAGEAQDRSGQAANLVPTGIRSRTVQPVVSRYTDQATGPIALLSWYWKPREKVDYGRRVLGIS